MALPQWWPLSSGSVCGKSIGPPPPDFGCRLAAPATSAQVQPWLAVPIRLHNDTQHDVVGLTSHTPWAAVTAADGAIVAVTTVMRSSARELTVPAGSFWDWTASVPLQRCRDRPVGAPREYLSAGTYQLWVDIEIRPDFDAQGVIFTLRGGPFDLLLEATRLD